MTKDERLSCSIARQFLKAVERLEAFSADPGMVYEDIRIVSCKSPKKVADTMNALANHLAGDSDAD